LTHVRGADFQSCLPPSRKSCNSWKSNNFSSQAVKFIY
jgi:hypothetical protein